VTDLSSVPDPSRAAPLILVTGATGTVGREVVRALLARGARVRALVRAPARASALPPDVERVAGDLGDPAAVARALEGTRAAFYVSPHEPDEERLADVFVRGCEASQTRLVFVGVHADAKTRAGRAVARWMMRLIIGRHYAAKFRLSERVRRAGVDTILLMPTNFYQNDELFRAELLAGEYVTPFSKRGINRVDVRDLGEAAARALLAPSIRPGAYAVVGPATLAGTDAAAAWSRALGREVRYTGDDFARFAALAAQRLDGKKRDDFLGSFRVIRKFSMATDPRALAVTTSLLGRPPRAYDAYVRDTLASWHAAPADPDRSRAVRVVT